MGYSSSISCGNASWNVWDDSLLWYGTQLQLSASLVVILISKPTIGNKSQRAIITEVLMPGITFVTFMEATISKHYTCVLIELNLNTRWSWASWRLSKIEFCCATSLSSCTFLSHWESFTFWANAWNICERVATQWDLLPPFRVFVWSKPLRNVLYKLTLVHLTKVRC